MQAADERIRIMNDDLRANTKISEDRQRSCCIPYREPARPFLYFRIIPFCLKAIGNGLAVRVGQVSSVIQSG